MRETLEIKERPSLYDLMNDLSNHFAGLQHMMEIMNDCCSSTSW